jgi:hypothetical protein
MAEAHKRTKAFIAKGECIMTYAAVLRVTLRHCHSENKAMKEVNPVEAWKAQAIANAQARIAELEAIDTTDGFIVVVGDNIRLPMDEVQGKWCRVERASIFWYREDAQRFAGRIVNGNGEAGQVVKKIDQIAWEISEQNKLIESIKTGF